jgi:hypothetical protein
MVISNKVDKATAVLHENGLVFGDLRPPTHLLGGARIHTLSVMADGGWQLVTAMVLYFTTKRAIFYPSEPPFNRRES